MPHNVHAPERFSVVTVFGGEGNPLTHFVVKECVRKGFRVRLMLQRPYKALDLRTLGALGQVDLQFGKESNDAHIKRALQGASAVINLFDTYNKSKLRGVFVDFPQRLTALLGGIPLVHLSRLGASQSSPVMYEKMRAKGEEVIGAKVPHATIMQTSLVFCPKDKFFNSFAFLLRNFPVLAVFGKMLQAKCAPIYAGDVAKAVVEAIMHPQKYAGTYALEGAQIYSVKGLLELISVVTGHKKRIISLPKFVGYLAALGSMLVTRDPFLTTQLVCLLERDAVASDVAKKEGRTLEAFGVNQTSLLTVLPTYLYRYRKDGQFSALAQSASLSLEEQKREQAKVDVL